MAFYIFSILFLIFFGLFGTYGKNREFAVISRGFVFLWLFFFSAVRYGIGTDYSHYEASYIAIGSGKEFYKFSAPLYYYLACFCTGFHFSYKTFIAITSFLTLHFFWKSLQKRFFIYMILLYYVLIYVQAFCLIRQMLACTISIYALLQYRNNRIKCLIFLIIASLFHASFWLMVFLYVFQHTIRFSHDFVCIIVPVLFIIVCFSELFPLLIRIILQLLHISVGTGYFNINRHIGPVMLIRYVYIFCFFLLFRELSKNDYLVNLIFFAMFFSEFVGTQLGMFAARLPQTMYSGFFLIFSNNYSKKLIRTIQKRNIYFADLLACIDIATFIFIVQLMTTHHLNNCMPYQSFLF